MLWVVYWCGNVERGSGRLGVVVVVQNEIQTRPDGPEAVAVYVLDRVLTCEVFSRPADPTLSPLASFLEGKSVFSLSGSLLDWSH